MTSPRNDAPTRRIGLRAVAEAAGVSLMTVSLALRNSPRVLPDTGKQVRAVAERLGYTPDPEISRLMRRLRPARSAGGVVLAMIDVHPERLKRLQAYDVRVRAGIERRARQLGYSVSLFSLHEYGGRLSQLLRVVRCRGITGALLLPATPTVALDPKVNWDGLSVMAVTTSVISPQFHQVVPNHLLNIRTLMENLRVRGFKRFGLILSESLHRRTHETYAMAMTTGGHRAGVLIIADSMAAGAAAAAVIEWLETRDPDVIVGGDLMLRLLKTPALARRCSGREIVALTNPADRELTYLDQQPDLIGECAVGLLTGMIHNNETGVPVSPQVTAIRGTIQLGERRTTKHLPSASPTV
jgi:LacI family transcriptional regulator